MVVANGSDLVRIAITKPWFVIATKSAVGRPFDLVVLDESQRIKSIEHTNEVNSLDSSQPQLGFDWHSNRK